VGCCTDDRVEGTLRHPSFFKIRSPFGRFTRKTGIIAGIQTDFTVTHFYVMRYDVMTVCNHPRSIRGRSPIRARTGSDNVSVWFD
jgi:hypothetical protein